MERDFYILPDDFGDASGKHPVHFYSAARSSAKNKVHFKCTVVCFVMNGRKEAHSATVYETAGEGELLFFPSGSVLMSESTAGSKGYAATLIFIDDEILADYIPEVKGPVHHEPAMAQIFKVSGDPYLEHFFQSLSLLRSNALPQLYNLKIRELLAYIQLRYPSQLAALASVVKCNNALRAVATVVQCHAGKGLTVAEMAFLCNMSPSTFKRRFSEIYHQPPQRYLHELRMHESLRMLANQKKPSEIYSTLGYENLSSFSSAFRKHFGSSPKHYLRNFDLREKVFDPTAKPSVEYI